MASPLLQAHTVGARWLVGENEDMRAVLGGRSYNQLQNDWSTNSMSEEERVHCSEFLMSDQLTGHGLANLAEYLKEGSSAGVPAFSD